MKNLYLIPTDKPSKLYKVKEKFYIEEYPVTTVNAGNQNIYITNSEEIKEGDWILNPTNEVQTCIGLEKGIGTDNICWVKVKETTTLQQILNSQKIILTTDLDLIKDGVQSIDDDFLEWFVKNPSCEEVDVENNYRVKSGTIQEHNEGKAGYEYYEYKIIISSEEPKQIKCYCGHTTYCDCSPLEEPRKETLEEAANEYFKLSHSRLVNKQQKEYERELFIAGAKWQQERSYSEEDVIKIVKKSRETGLTAEYLLLTYGSKGSDDHIPDTRKMVSSQTEISDEKIEKAARDYDNGNIYGPPLVNFEQGAFWYREQLKQK